MNRHTTIGKATLYNCEAEVPCCKAGVKGFIKGHTNKPWLGRKAIGIELKDSYYKQALINLSYAKTRFNETSETKDLFAA